MLKDFAIRNDIMDPLTGFWEAIRISRAPKCSALLPLKAYMARFEHHKIIKGSNAVPLNAVGFAVSSGQLEEEFNTYLE